MPDNLSSFQDSSYSKADLYRFIAAQTLQQDIGSTWDYSNLDYWLLQEAIATRGRADFEQLMQKRVIAPLGLRSTTLTLSPELQARVAIGHDAVMQPTRPRLRGHDTRRSRSMLQRWIHTLDSYAGRYDLQDEGVTTIARDGGSLTIELPASWGLPKLSLHAEGQRDFFATELPLRVTFEVDANNRVTGMLVHPPRSQRTIPAQRLQP